MSYSFDCDNKVIQLDTTNELDMMDLYSRWKDEVLSVASGCEQAMRVIKEPLAGSTFIGPYYFIMNDWQIRPLDTAHELVVAGTVVQDETSVLQSFKLDDLTAVVSIVRQVAVEVQVLEVSVPAVNTPAEIADAVWDEVIDNQNHNDAKSAGKRLRQAGTTLAVEGSVNDSSATTTSFITDLTQTQTSFYADQTMVFVSGAHEGQARIITNYDGPTKVVTFDEPWTNPPADGDEFEIKADHVHPVSEIQAGLATKSDVYGASILRIP